MSDVEWIPGSLLDHAIASVRIGGVAIEVMQVVCRVWPLAYGHGGVLPQRLHVCGVVVLWASEVMCSFFLEQVRLPCVVIVLRWCLMFAMFAVIGTIQLIDALSSG